MPRVEMCHYCKKKMNPETEEYVVVVEAIQESGFPRRIAHVECHSKSR